MQGQNNDKKGNIAKALAETLAKIGVVSDLPEDVVPPRVSAYQAYTRVYPGNDRAQWIDFFGTPNNPNLPKHEEYRKMAEICLRAIRQNLMPDFLWESTIFAWGYFSGLYDREIERLQQNKIAKN